MPNYLTEKIRRDVIVWEDAQKAWADVDRDLSKRCLDAIDAAIADRAVSTCCKSMFKKMRREWAEAWPEKLEKILLRQDGRKRRGKVYSRHK